MSFGGQIMLKISSTHRWIGLAFDGGVVLLFGCVLIGAGHGVGPIGLLMIFGMAEAWAVPMVVGWLSIAALALAALVPQRELYVTVVLLGLTLLVISWWLFISQSSSMVASIVPWSVPFLAALAGRAVFLVISVRKGIAT